MKAGERAFLAVNPFVAAAFLWLMGPQAAHAEPASQPLSLAAFSDGIKHWQDRHGTAYARYQPQQVNEIADNLLLYQRDNGAWIENRDPARILDATEKAALVAEKSQTTGSFDNRNIYSQIEYLAAAFELTGRPACRDAAARGLDYALAQQITGCGGWPHSVPGTASYHRYITIADEVTSGMLRLLRQVSAGADPFGYVDAATRARATAALERGDECVLKLQVRQNGQLTGWAGQYHPETLAPAQGRAFELPSIVSQETVEMLRYLMSIPQPSEAQVRSIENAVAWLRRSQISGVRIKKVALAKPVQYPYHVATFDHRLVEDAHAPPLWARFYDLADNSVVLANRDSVRVKEFSQVHPERRSGYAWFGTWPAPLLTEEYPAWRARQARSPRESARQGR
jgi:PelA/Pel-15E family pectate lyase